MTHSSGTARSGWSTTRTCMTRCARWRGRPTGATSALRPLGPAGRTARSTPRRTSRRPERPEPPLLAQRGAQLGDLLRERGEIGLEPVHALRERILARRLRRRRLLRRWCPRRSRRRGRTPLLLLVEVAREQVRVALLL